MTIKVGDVVTYQKPRYVNSSGQGFQPLGVRGCKVLRINKGISSCEPNLEVDIAELEAFGEKWLVRLDYCHKD